MLRSDIDIIFVAVIKTVKDYVEESDKECVQALHCLGVFGIKDDEGKQIYFMTRKGSSTVQAFSWGSLQKTI